MVASNQVRRKLCLFGHWLDEFSTQSRSLLVVNEEGKFGLSFTLCTLSQNLIGYGNNASVV